MKTFEELYNYILNEAGRPATAFKYNITMNDAYAFALSVMRQNGETNAATYAIWDYIWRLLPNEIKSPELIKVKKTLGTDGIKNFIHTVLKVFETYIDTKKIISGLSNRKKIEQYLNRPIKKLGNRNLKKVRSRLRPHGHLPAQENLMFP